MKSIYCIFLFAIMVHSAIAQGSDEEIKVVEVEGTTYGYFDLGRRYVAYNQGIPWIEEYGTCPGPKFRDGYVSTEVKLVGMTPQRYFITIPENRNDIVREAFKAVFTAEELAEIDGYFLFIDIFLNTSDARFVGIKYMWDDYAGKSPYTDIPLEKLRQIEILLGKQLKYKITDLGKNLSFNWDRFIFKGLDDITPVNPPDWPERYWKLSARQGMSYD